MFPYSQNATRRLSDRQWVDPFPLSSRIMDNTVAVGPCRHPAFLMRRTGGLKEKFWMTPDRRWIFRSAPTRAQVDLMSAFQVAASELLPEVRGGGCRCVSVIEAGAVERWRRSFGRERCLWRRRRGKRRTPREDPKSLCIVLLMA